MTRSQPTAPQVSFTQLFILSAAFPLMPCAVLSAVTP